MSLDIMIDIRAALKIKFHLIYNNGFISYVIVKNALKYAWLYIFTNVKVSSI